MIVAAQRDSRSPAEQSETSGMSTRQEKPSRIRCSPVPRLARAWQRRGAGIRTGSSAPAETGLTLNGMCWLNSLPRRCQSLREVHRSNPRKSTGILAAAREPSVVSILPSPKNLSAFYRQRRRQNSPSPILGGGEPCRRNGYPLLRATPRQSTSLRSMRTSSPRLGNQPMFARTHTALAGTIGVDSKTGAAIHGPVVPGESA